MSLSAGARGISFTFDNLYKRGGCCCYSVGLWKTRLRFPQAHGVLLPEVYRILTIGLSYQVIAILTGLSYQVIAAVSTK